MSVLLKELRSLCSPTEGSPPSAECFYLVCTPQGLFCLADEVMVLSDSEEEEVVILNQDGQ